MNVDIIKNICKELQTTYDAKYISSGSKGIRQLFTDIGEKYYEHRGSSKGNQVLLNLITNYINPIIQKPIAKYINGPYTISLHYSEKYKMTIYTFGEYHWGKNCSQRSIKDSVVNIERYLTDLFYSTDVFIDFYLEMRKGDIYDRHIVKTSGAHNILNKLSDCIKPETRYTKSCQLYRFHFINIREQKGNILFHISRLYYYKKSYRNREKTIELFNLIKSRGELYRYTNRKTVIDVVINDIYDLSALDKEVSRSFLGDDVRRYYYKKAERYLLPYKNELVKTFQYLDKATKVTPYLKGKLEFIGQIAFSLMSYSMDIYTLSRIFKRFKVGKDSYMPEQPHNIIIYTGDAHSRSYREFFEYLNFTKVKEIRGERQVVKDWNQCLDMKDFPQPFFNKLYY